jgi:hypothetical protein
MLSLKRYRRFPLGGLFDWVSQNWIYHRFGGFVLKCVPCVHVYVVRLREMLDPPPSAVVTGRSCGAGSVG